MTSLSPRSPEAPVPSPIPRICGPVELVQAVPYLLGFHPEASLVLIGMRHGMLVVTARLDLADLAVEPLLSDTIDAMARGGSTSIVAVAYPAAAGPGDESVTGDLLPAGRAGFVQRITDHVRDAGCELSDLLVVCGGRWRSALCEDGDCCPWSGTALVDQPTSFTVAATVSGVAPLTDRRALVATLAPAPEAEQLDAAAIDTAAHEAVTATLTGTDRRHRETLLRELRRWARDYDGGPEPPTADQAARWVVALAETQTRDQLWLEVDERSLDGRPLWRELARRAPARYRAVPLLLFGWASWRSGDGASATIAAERAVECDPSFTAADLLLAVVTRYVDPRSVPPLLGQSRRARRAGAAAIRTPGRRRRGR